MRPVLLVLLAVITAVGLGACGGGGDDHLTQAEIEARVDAQNVGQENVGDDASASQLAKDQLKSDADQKAAEEAIKRRHELIDIQKKQKKATEDFLKKNSEKERAADDVAADNFRAKIAGVCDGAFTSITKVSKAAKKAEKSKDPQALLKVAGDYNDTLNNFLDSLKSLDAPASEQALYTSWLGTIDDLSNTIRLQLVSFADPSAVKKYTAKTQKLTTKFLTQTAQLGVTCLSVTG